MWRQACGGLYCNVVQAVQGNRSLFQLPGRQVPECMLCESSNILFTYSSTRSAKLHSVWCPSKPRTAWEMSTPSASATLSPSPSLSLSLFLIPPLPPPPPLLDAAGERGRRRVGRGVWRVRRQGDAHLPGLQRGQQGGRVRGRYAERAGRHGREQLPVMDAASAATVLFNPFSWVRRRDSGYVFGSRPSHLLFLYIKNRHRRCRHAEILLGMIRHMSAVYSQKCGMRAYSARVLICAVQGSEPACCWRPTHLHRGLALETCRRDLRRSETSTADGRTKAREGQRLVQSAIVAR